MIKQIFYSLMLTCIGFMLTIIDGEATIIAKILIPFWFFSIIPAYIFVIKWLNRKTFEESVNFGSRMGMAFEWLAFLIPVIIAPFLMALYYYDILKKNKYKER